MFSLENTEADLVWLSLVIFLPVLFAVPLVFFPRGKDELMRWWTLLGTAATMVVSICMFISYYYQVYNPHVATDNRDQSTLTARADRADQGQAGDLGSGRSHSDFVARYPW